MSTAPKHTTKGMTREQIAKQSHERRTILLAYIDRNGRCDMNQLEAGLAMPRVVLFQWLKKMTQTGHIITEQETTKISLVNYYSRGPNQEPLQVYAHGAGRVKYEPREMVVRRKIVPAKQIGMHRDPLDVWFFGPARAEVQA